MPKSLCVFIALSFASPLATADIFKCSGDNGVTVYKNFPCAIDSIGSKASAAPAPESRPPPIAATVAERPAAALAVETARALGPPQEPRIGMTSAEVRNSTWGDPTTTATSEEMQGLIEIWSYSGDRTVQFDSKGRVFRIGS